MMSLMSFKSEIDQLARPECMPAHAFHARLQEG